MCPPPTATRITSRGRASLFGWEHLFFWRMPRESRCEKTWVDLLLGGGATLFQLNVGAVPRFLNARTYSQSFTNQSRRLGKEFLCQMQERSDQPPILYHSQTSPSQAGRYRPFLTDPLTTHKTQPELMRTASVVTSSIHLTQSSVCKTLRWDLYRWPFSAYGGEPRTRSTELPGWFRIHSKQSARISFIIRESESPFYLPDGRLPFRVAIPFDRLCESGF